MTTRYDHEHQLDQHLRRTLTAVAATVHERPDVAAVPGPGRSRRRRRVLVGVGVTLSAIPLAAAAVVRFGPEYVDRIPPANPVVEGSIDGERYWVVDGRDIQGCEGTPSGVELIAEEQNIVGREWNTVASFFGEPTADGCAPRPADRPPRDTYYSDGGTVVGDGMLWMGALHPDVDEVRVALDGGAPFDADIFEHEGGAYYVLKVPPGTDDFTVEYVVEGDVLAPPSGVRTQHTVPR